MGFFVSDFCVKRVPTKKDPSCLTIQSRIPPLKPGHPIRRRTSAKRGCLMRYGAICGDVKRKAKAAQTVIWAAKGLDCWRRLKRIRLSEQSKPRLGHSYVIQSLGLIYSDLLDVIFRAFSGSQPLSLLIYDLGRQALNKKRERNKWMQFALSVVQSLMA